MFLSSRRFFQKTNKQIRVFCLTVLKMNERIRFRKNSRISKSTFEIIWPLVGSKKIWGSIHIFVAFSEYMKFRNDSLGIQIEFANTYMNVTNILKKGL